MKSNSEYFIMDRPEKPGVRGKLHHLYSKSRYLLFNLYYSQVKINVIEKKYKVSICAIFKNEAPYLKEWIEFNHLVGIDHFYMYNNNSDDGFRKILQPYIESGLITLLEWPYNQKQMECYMDCIERFSTETKWLGFIDIDEFIVPKSTDDVYSFLKPFESKRGAVRIYWKLFGSSGMFERNLEGLVTEDFTVCWPKYCDIGKCFYNTAFDFDKNSKYSKYLHHDFWAKWKGRNIPPVNIFDKICMENINIACTNEFPIQINHYFTKSFNEYTNKCAKGDVYFELNPHDEEYFFEHEMKCLDVDYSAYKYLIKLKKRMGNFNE